MTTESGSTTIAALATAPAPAGIAVVRVSGPQARTVFKALFRSKRDPVADPRRLAYGDLLDYKTGDVIDHSMAVYMPGPFSFTGEDIAEFQFHGSPLLVQKVLRSLFAFGISPAEPGEFTRRAFLNGKMDLVQAEAIADLINATSEQALKIAGEHLNGRFSAALAEIGEPLRNLLAECEAGIDFPEEDIETSAPSALLPPIREAQKKLALLLESYSYGAVVKEGFRVLLCGQPNVGKSSILNLLLGKDRAIVSDISGTTRDLIEEQATFGGYRFVFCDSAGLGTPSDKVEQIGIELARERVTWADLVLFVVDSSDKSGAWEETIKELRGRAKKIWMITNKIDLNPNAIGSFFCDSSTCAQNFYLSAKTRDGLQNLIDALVEEVTTNLSQNQQADTSQIVTNERQRNCLWHAQEALVRCETAVNESLPAEIVSAELRLALAALEEIVGKTYTEDILGRIFSKFCIGK